MHHPFELDIAELKSINFEFEEIKEKVAENITGGSGTGTFSSDIVFNSIPETEGGSFTDLDFVPPAN